MIGYNFLNSPEIRKIHFIGIGGSSMSGLAEILVHLGYSVTGSDMRASAATQKLENLGVKVYPFHDRNHLGNPDLVVYTVAVKEDNPELAEARQRNIAVIDRAELLGQIMKRYPFSIAVSGTHGKTTTTSMISMIMLESGVDPNIHIGGELRTIGGNTRIGGSKFFVTEACEYYESFLKFNPYLAVILNIEADHLDYFKNIEHIKETFFKFASLVPQNGYLVACVDDSNVSSLFDRLSCNIITYGLHSPQAMWMAKNIVFDDLGYASFTVVKEGQKFATIKLSVPGIHNVSNALAAIASCYTLGCDLSAIKEGLLTFTGTNRRFELKGITEDVKVIDDYAHHPTEVSATLKAAKNCAHPKVWCVFQPHTFTRTKLLLDDFATAFSDADTVIITDIYAAREADTGEIHSRMLADRIREKGQDVHYISSFDSIVEFLNQHALPGDLIITMGAGDVYKVGEMFIRSREVVPAR